MKIIRQILLQAFLFLSMINGIQAQETETVRLADGTEVVRTGVGVYENLGEIVYAGALYLPRTAAGPAAGISSRMELRIVTEGLSVRRFVRLWMDAITLSSSRDERVSQAERIQAFGELFKLDFRRGDHVRFDYLADSGKVVFRFNGTNIGEIEGEAFHSILMNAWIGESPASARLKAGLFSELDAGATVENRRLFSGLAIDESRAAETGRYYLQLREQERMEQARRQAAERRRQAEAEAARLEAERLAREREESARAAEQRRWAAQQEVLAADYRAQLNEWIRDYIEYPELAQQRREEGRVELSIVTDRHGRIENRGIVSSSGSNVLDDAALEMLERAVPLPAMPEGLAGETFSLTIPVNFALE